MMPRRSRTSYSLAGLLIGLCCVPALAATQTPLIGGREGTSRVVGTVFDDSGKAGLAGVRLVLRPLELPGVPPLEATTDQRGRFDVRGVPYGHYQVALVRDGAGFVANRVILVPPLRKVEARFRLGAVQSADDAIGLDLAAPVPGLAGPAQGVARLEEHTGPSMMEWIRTGKGVAVVIGGAALLVAALIVSGGNDTYTGTTTTPTPNPAPPPKLP